ncbi:hypothetical protein [Caballeronia novacaledonica]|uniref:Uncharacterized protein n=1 Tax=Caballeronia novacaledonica TaxID=1544861 RepID=A0AA37IC55_9BURK|nr:hypothetical protein [Caballeronia novacaledonica]GJH26972.1 hypothetical protein CBA19CS42_20670 [Caballeronia novacaledonica]
MKRDEKKILEDQINRWASEMTTLAEKIAAAKGAPCALLLITPQGDYENVAPELIAEDALRVVNQGWPEGFDVEILNRSK